jgi:hypothetical protein
LEAREASFLSIVRRAIFDNRLSPYRPLLEAAACEFGDVEKLVVSEGIEGTLRALLQAGVYLTVDEYKGRHPVERLGIHHTVSTQDLRNPLARLHVSASTSGSRGPSSPVLIDLEFIRACGANCLVGLAARGGVDWRKATWEVPGAGARFRLLKYASFGSPPERWFSHLAPNDPSLDPMFHWSHTALRATARLAGSSLPPPTVAPLADPTPMARWMAGVLQQGETPHSLTFVTSAVRLAAAALENGIDVSGAQLTVGGEPTTATRLAAIEKAGIIARPRYGSMECGPLGYACLKPESPDEVHFQSDLHALLCAEESADSIGVPTSALFVTTLHQAAPFVFLNVSMGDQGRLRRRSCGCPMEAEGWSTQIDRIRSFEKLTAAGMTFDDADVIEILEQTLPDRFGGGPSSYQLLEDSTPDGHSRLVLLVDPALGVVKDDEVKEVFLTALEQGSIIRPMMTRIWRDSLLLSVERRPPEATHTGKVHHVHLHSPGRS